MLWITCNLGLFVFFCCSQADTNNHRKIMTKITKCSLRAPICGEMATVDFFFHKIFKKAQLLFCCSLSDAHTHMPTYTHPHIHTHMRAHTIQIPRQAYRQTSGAEQKGKLRQRREEREKGWCLVFIIHTRVACSVTLFSCSSPLSLYPG